MNEVTDLRTRAIEIAARIWCDQEMSHLTMDEKAAMEIASIIERVISDQFDKDSNHKFT
jgi:hypothetical protein